MSEEANAVPTTVCSEIEKDQIQINENTTSKIIQYGPSKSQFFRLSLPTILQLKGPSAPVIVIIHGGFWKQKYSIDNSAIESLAPFFVSQGFAACEVEYRRIPPAGNTESNDEDCFDRGGYPATNNDIQAALEKIFVLCRSCAETDIIPLNADKIVLVGHSAGGYLALWSCRQGSAIPFRPALCVGLAPICDLFEATKRR